ncbi:unnamed protein product, partial [Darwinula stevensoni]
MSICGNAKRCLKFSVQSHVWRGVATAVAPDVKPFDEIPGPKRVPLLGTIWEALPLIGKPPDLARMHKFFMAKYDRYGVIWREEMPMIGKLVFITKPEDIEILCRNEGKMPEREILAPIKYYRTVVAKDTFENPGILIANGEAWYTIRSKVQQKLLKPQSVLSYLPVMNEVADDFVKRIKALQNENQEMPEDFQNELFKFALESISCVALNSRLGCFKEGISADSEPMQMISAVIDTFDALNYTENKLPLWKYFPSREFKKLIKAQDLFTQVAIRRINEAIEKAKEKLVSQDAELTVLETMLTNPQMRPKEVLVMILDMLLAGIDTTSHSIAFTIYNLAKNPDVQEKARAEVLRTIPDKNAVITPAALNELSYLKACVKENLRLFPVVGGILRVLPKDVTLSGYMVPKGTWVIAFSYMFSTLEEYFDEPLKFKPERWLRESGTKSHPFAHLPFGFGPRMCVGRRIAEQEMWVVLAKLLQHFNIEYHHADIQIQTRLLNTPDKPLKIGMQYIKEAIKKFQKRVDGNEQDLSVLESLLTQSALTEKEVLVMILDMLLAGVDTTSNTIGFALYHLARNPEAQERLHEEVKRVLPTKETKITPQILNGLSYVKACIKETLRLNPIAAGTFRQFDHDVVVGGYHIPKKVLFFLVTFITSRLEKYYPDPEAFKPERWLRGQRSDVNPFATLPFGHGPRSCIGRRIAEQEMWLLLIKVANRYKKYGPIWKEVLPFRFTSVNVVRPEDIEMVFRLEGKTPARPGLQSLKEVRQKHLEEQLQNPGILIANGEDWYKIRSQVQQSMMKPKSALLYLQPMEKVAKEFVERMKSIRDANGELPADFINELYKWAVSLVALDRRLGCLEPNLSKDSPPQRMIQAVNDMFAAMNRTEQGALPWWKIFPTPSWKKLVHSQRTHMEISLKFIGESMKTLKQRSTDEDRDPSVLEILLSRTDLTQKEVLVMILDMLFAGIDTVCFTCLSVQCQVSYMFSISRCISWQTSNTIGFTMYHLAKNPEKQEKLYEEVKKILPSKDMPITPKVLNELSFVKACIKETLRREYLLIFRLNPVTVGTLRVLDCDIVLSGYHIPRGMHLITMNYIASHLEEYYPEPEKFKPERWLRGQKDEITAFASIPFGHGARMCIGRRIAEQEMWLLLTKVIQNFYLEYHHEDIGILSRLVERAYSATPMKKNAVHKFFWSRYKKYGPIWREVLPLRFTSVNLVRPEDIEMVFRLEGKNPDRPSLESMKEVRLKYLDEELQNPGVLLANGEEWYRIRSRVQQSMMKPKSALLYLKPMEEVTEEFVERMKSLRDASGELPADFINELYKWAVSLVALDRRLGCLEPNLSKDSPPQRMIEAVNDMFAAMNRTEFGTLPWWKFFPTPSWKKLVQSQRTHMEISLKFIDESIKNLKERRVDEDRDPSVLEILLSRTDLTQKEVLVMILDMLFAGIDTTSNTVAFTMFHLAKNPEKQEKLYEEVKKVLPSKDMPITPKVLNELSFVKACIKETLRLNPIASGTLRVLDRDVVLSGYHIPKGMFLFTMNIIASRLEEYYPEPEKFKPERWLRGQKDEVTAFASIPFGHGSRMCIGRRIAEQEMWLLLTKVTFISHRSKATDTSYGGESVAKKTPLPFQDVPGTRSIPVLGSMWDVAIPFLRYMKYGPIWRDVIPLRFTIVNLVRPEDIEMVFQLEGKTPERPGLMSLKEVRQKYLEEHLQNPGILMALVALDRRLGCLEPNLSEDSPPQRMIQAVNDMFAAINRTEQGVLPWWKFFPTPSWKKLVHSQRTHMEISLKFIDESIKILKERGASVEGDPSVLELLLSRTDLTRKEVLVMILDMLLGGIDTVCFTCFSVQCQVSYRFSISRCISWQTSNTVGFTMYHLAKNPEKQEKLYEEVKKVLPSKDMPITPKILNELSFVKACIKETLRLNPVFVGTLRVLDCDIVLSGYHIPKGVSCLDMHLITMNYIASRLEEYYPEPEKFKPERWLRGQKDEATAFASIPFGHGARMCIGRRIAEQEMWLLLTKDEVIPLSERFLEFVLKNGEEWYKIRSRVQQSMLKPKSALLYLKPMEEVAEEFVERMKSLRDANGELPADFINELYKWGLESVSLVTLDRRLGCLEPNLSEDSPPQRMIQAVNDIISLKFIDESIKNLKERRVDEEREPSVLEILLSKTDLTQKEVFVMILDMLFAGIDTVCFTCLSVLCQVIYMFSISSCISWQTSNTVGFTMYHLGKNPEKQEKLYEELKKVLPSKNMPITPKILNELSFVKACIKETLRLIPIALGTIRVLDCDVVLSGYHIPKGMHLITMNYIASHLEEYYPEPEKFKPERWLQGQKDEVTAFASIPFGHGARMCIGRRIAEQEMWLLLIKVTRDLSFPLPEYKKYGPIWREVFPLRFTAVSLVKPEDIKMMFRLEGKTPERPSLESMKEVRLKYLDEQLQNPGVLLANGKEWYRIRSRVQQSMMKLKSALLYLKPMEEVAEEFVKRMKSLRDASGELPADFINELYKWAVSLVALDRKLGCLEPNLSKDSPPQRMIGAVNDMLAAVNKTEFGALPWWKFFPTPSWKKLVQSQRTHTEISLKFIDQSMKALKERRADEDRDPSVLEILLSRTDLTQKEVLVMILDMLSAGIDTCQVSYMFSISRCISWQTSNTVAFTMYHLAKNPEKQEKLYEEVKDILPSKDTPITPKVLNELSYLKACIKETFRLNPIVSGTARVLDRDVVLSGYHIPKGVFLISVNIITSRLEEYFPEPDKFKPERWLRGQKDELTPFASIPFGHGARMCLGRRIAEQEMWLLLTKYNYTEQGVPKGLERLEHLQIVYDNVKNKGRSREVVREKLLDIGRQFRSTQLEVHQLIRQAHASLSRLKEIALEPDVFTVTEYIDLLIQQEKRHGNSKRVEALEASRQAAMWLSAMTVQEDWDPFDQPLSDLKKIDLELMLEDEDCDIQFLGKPKGFIKTLNIFSHRKEILAVDDNERRLIQEKFSVPPTSNVRSPATHFIMMEEVRLAERIRSRSIFMGQIDGYDMYELKKEVVCREENSYGIYHVLKDEYPVTCIGKIVMFVGATGAG